MNRCDIVVGLLGVSISFCTTKSITKKVELAIAKQEALTISYANKYVLLSAQKRNSLKEYLTKINLLYQDGIGVYLAGKSFASLTSKEKINATDTNYSILEFANKNRKKVFFFGGSKDASANIFKVVKEKYPDLNITGNFERVEKYTEELIDVIRKSSADILFVGLGTPYQEEWLANYARLVNIPVQIGVGSWFEFLTGTERRAPLVLRKVGLEWIYRLLQNPMRLWKRYILGIPIFWFQVLKQKMFGI